MTDSNNIHVADKLRIEDSSRLHPTMPNINKAPVWLIITVVMLSMLPDTLNILGVELGVSPYSHNAAQVDSHVLLAEKAQQMILFNPSASNAIFVNHMFYGLNGAFWHMMLELSAVMVAVITAILAFAHYRVQRNFVVPFIGLVLLAAGGMDMYHTAAASRLIEVSAPDSQLIPFTWAEARVFSALTLLFGVFLLLFTRLKQSQHIPILITTTIFLFIAAAAIISITSSSAELPQSQFEDALIKRPYDVIPLILYIVLGAILLPILNRRSPSIFYSSLILSMLPQVMAQIHMAFSSEVLFDNGFNISHGLKTLSYLIPCLGIVLDYVAIAQRSNLMSNNLEQMHEEIKTQVAKSVAKLKNVAEDVGHKAVALASSSIALSDLVNQQSLCTAQSASAMEEMTCSVGDVSNNAKQVAGTTQSANNNASSSSETVTQSIGSLTQIAEAVSVVSTKIEYLNDNSEEIGKVVSVIDSIAEQTNLLALNAAIEAARAGEHGKGFSVVADEVRGLARKTQNATNKIAQTISSNQIETQQSVESMRQSMVLLEEGTELASIAKKNMEDIVDSFEQVSSMISQIATANTQQAIVARDISQQLNHINNISSEMVNTISEVTSASEHLSRLSETAQNLAQSLDLSNHKR